MAHPDEVCGVCGFEREAHGDSNHEFNLEGVLVAKKAPEPPRKTAPAATDQIKAYAFLELIEVLIEKQLLDTRDVARILSADIRRAPSGG